MVYKGFGKFNKMDIKVKKDKPYTIFTDFDFTRPIGKVSFCEDFNIDENDIISLGYSIQKVKKEMKGLLISFGLIPVQRHPFLHEKSTSKTN